MKPKHLTISTQKKAQSPLSGTCKLCSISHSDSSSIALVRHDRKEICCTDSNDAYFIMNNSIYNQFQDGDLVCNSCIRRLLDKGDIKLNVHVASMCCLCGRNVHGPDQSSTCSSSVRSWARVDGGNKFTYGLHGTFKFLDLDNLEPGSVVCEFCLNQHTYVPYECVECDHCHRKYQGCMRLTDIENGKGCAAHVERNGIVCGYGSKYDDLVIPCAIPGQVPEELHVGMRICDNCIESLLKSGKYVLQQQEEEELVP
jgi:hypothetical protein